MNRPRYSQGGAMSTQPLLSETVGVPEAIVRVLAEAGVRFVIGMPGGRTIPIWNALHTSGGTVRPVLVREEGLASVMADVVGRLTGVPAVCMGQAAFMLTNSGMGIVEAYLAGSPMLVLSDLSDGSPFSHHAPYQSGTGDYGSWDARGNLRLHQGDFCRTRAGTGGPGDPACHQARPGRPAGPGCGALSQPGVD